MKLTLYVSFALLLGMTSSQAEIEKIAVPTASGMQFYWWPSLDVADGWQHDLDVSLQTQTNMIIPLVLLFQMPIR